MKSLFHEREMKQQEIFDLVAIAMFKQGKPSVTKCGTRCLYRSHDGCKCAIGHIIPDDLYKPGMEGSSIESIWNSFNFPEYFHEIGVQFFMDLQRTHDDAIPSKGKRFLTEFVNNMRKLATDYRLDASILDRHSK